MRVYTHYFKDENTGIECRWRTLLQIGESWDCMGSVYMKNPGSSIYQEVDAQGRAIPIQNADTLALLEAFTQEKSVNRNSGNVQDRSQHKRRNDHREPCHFLS